MRYSFIRLNVFLCDIVAQTLSEFDQEQHSPVYSLGTAHFSLALLVSYQSSLQEIRKDSKRVH